MAEELGIGRALGNAAWAKAALFLVLARVAHQGSRLSAVRWAADQAVGEVLGLGKFDEDDLYRVLDELADAQPRIEQKLYRETVRRRGGTPPVLVLYDVTSSYLEGQCHELGEYGYNRDGKRGKRQILVGLLTDERGEPLAVRVFKGNRADPTTIGTQIEILKEQFGIEVVVFVGDRGMVKSLGKDALKEADLRYITALTDPQIRKLLKQGTLQMGLFEEKVCEVEAGGLRYVLRKNPEIERKQHHRVEDKLAKLIKKVEARNGFVAGSERAVPESGLRQLEAWIRRHKLDRFVRVSLKERMLVVEIDEAAREEVLLLAGCYVIETDVPARSARGRAGPRLLQGSGQSGAGLAIDEDRVPGNPARVPAQSESDPGPCPGLHAGLEDRPGDGTTADGSLRHHRHGSSCRDLTRRSGGSEPSVLAALLAGEWNDDHPASSTGLSSTEPPRCLEHHLAQGTTAVGRTFSTRIPSEVIVLQ